MFLNIVRTEQKFHNMLPLFFFTLFWGILAFPPHFSLCAETGLQGDIFKFWFYGVLVCYLGLSRAMGMHF